MKTKALHCFCWQTQGRQRRRPPPTDVTCFTCQRKSLNNVWRKKKKKRHLIGCTNSSSCQDKFRWIMICWGCWNPNICCTFFVCLLCLPSSLFISLLFYEFGTVTIAWMSSEVYGTVWGRAPHILDKANKAGPLIYPTSSLALKSVMQIISNH